MNDRAANILRTIDPKSIVVIGGKTAGMAIRQSRALGYAGRIYAIHPDRPEIEGVPCLRSVKDLPEAPDVAFLATSNVQTVQLVKQLAAIGAGGAVCYASGFAELGGEGVELQADLVEAAGDMALIGPNCYGLINYLKGAALWPDQQGGQRASSGVAIITQSGNIAFNITMQRRNLPLAYMITVGNKAQTDIDALIRALAEDSGVTAIGLHIEGLTDLSAFAEAVRFAQSRGKTFVALKTGRSDIGAKMALSHTSSLAGADTLYDALFSRLGIARVEDLNSLLEALKVLHICGPLPVPSVATLSCSGGEASLAADLACAHGIDMPPLSPEAKQRLQALLGERVAVVNPLDYQTFIWGKRDEMTEAFAATMQAGAAMTLLILDFPRQDRCATPDWDLAVDAFIAAHQQTRARAGIVATMAEGLPEPVSARLASFGVVPLLGLDTAMRALAAAHAAMPGTGEPVRFRPAAAPTRVDSLDERTGKRMLAAHGLVIPRHVVVETEAEAVAGAQSLGFPVVMKAVSATLAHKTEAGGVKLNLRDEKSVRDAFAALKRLSDSVLVEGMVTGALAELIIGVTRDPQFSLSLTIGAGGVLVDILKDAQTLLFPVSRDDIRAAIGRLRCAPLLTGFRGGQAADMDKVLDAVEAVCRYVEAEGAALEELDVNPLIVTADAAIAVDVLIRRRANAAE